MRRRASEASDGFRQVLIPGLIGLSVFTDGVYLRAMHDHVAQKAAGARGVSRLRYLLRTLDFAQLIEHVRDENWDLAEEQIADASAALQAGGADFIVICANTGYALTGVTRQRITLPLLDIAEPVCRAIRAANLRTPGLLSTRKTEEAGVYRAQAKKHGLTLVSPTPSVAQEVHELILDELASGHFSDKGVRILESAARSFEANGADCVILGCTDLTHLVPQLQRAGACNLPLFDSTRLHAAAAAEAAITGELQGSLIPA
jgi:aspartate racemase